MIILYRNEKHYLVKLADAEEYIELAARTGLHICASINNYTDDETYVDVSIDDIRRQWRILTSYGDDVPASHVARIWTADYLVARPGPAYVFDAAYKRTRRDAGLAGVASPRWRYHNSGVTVTWEIEVGLHYYDDPLPAEAVRMLHAISDVATVVM